jgi:hypothetical protein
MTSPVEFTAVTQGEKKSSSSTPFSSGTYDATTKTYTSPSGEKQTRRIENVPKGTTIIFSKPTGAYSTGGASPTSPSVNIEALPMTTKETPSPPAQTKAEIEFAKIQDYYKSQIKSGTKYTPEKLRAIEKDFGVYVGESGRVIKKEYLPRLPEEETGVRITPEGKVYGYEVGGAFKETPNMFGGETIEARKTYSIKDLFKGQVNIPTFMDYAYARTIGSASRNILDVLPESKFKSFLAGETYPSYLISSIIKPLSATETFKYAIFSPLMTSTFSSYKELISSGQITPIAETRFYSQIEKDRVITLSTTEIGGLKSYGVAYQKLTDFGKVSLGKGFGINIIKKDISSFAIYSRNIPLETAKLKTRFTINAEDFGEGVISQTLIKDLGEKYPIQVRYRQTLGTVFPSKQENLFGYAGSKDYIKTLTPKGFVYRIPYSEIMGYVKVIEKPEVTFIGGIKSPVIPKTITFSFKGATSLAEKQSSALTNLMKQEVTSYPIQKIMPTQLTTQISRIKSTQTSFIKQEQPQREASRFRFFERQGELSSAKEIYKLRYSSPSAQSSALNQESKLSLKEFQAQKLRTPQTQRFRFEMPKPPSRPSFQRFPIPKISFQTPRFNLGLPETRRRYKEKKRKSQEGIFYTPSFTARALGLTKVIPSAKFKQFKGGDVFRPIPIIK